MSLYPHNITPTTTTTTTTATTNTIASTTTTTTIKNTALEKTSKNLKGFKIPHSQMPTATTIAGTDAWLWKIMQKEKNRDMIALLEDNLHDFLLNSNQSSLTFPPRNAFHRRVCFAVARRYGLEHRLESTNNVNDNNGSVSAIPKQSEEEIEDETQIQQQQQKQILTNDKEIIRLVLIKTHYSKPPPTRLDQFANGPQPPSLPPSSSSSSSLTPSHPANSLPSINSVNYSHTHSNTSSPSTSTDFNNFIIPNNTSNINNQNSLSVDGIFNLNENNSTDNSDLSQLINTSLSTASASASRPATFLRRPRTADGKLKRATNGSHLLSNCSTGALPLKNFTEEDYQKMRARIFKNPKDIDNKATSTPPGACIAADGVDCEQKGEEIKNSSDLRLSQGGCIAKGPVEGSPGFERRRNRRTNHTNNHTNNNNNNSNNNSSNTNSNNFNSNNHSNIKSNNNPNHNSIVSSAYQHTNGSGGRTIRRINSSVEIDHSGKKNNNNNGNNLSNGRIVLKNSRHKNSNNNNNKNRSTKDGVRLGSGNDSINEKSSESKKSNCRTNKTSNINQNGGTGNSGLPNLASNGRKYSSESNLGDIKDPDFDRSYVKWARREPICANLTNTDQSNSNNNSETNIEMAMYHNPHLVYSSYGTTTGPPTTTTTTPLPLQHPHHSFSQLHVHPTHHIHPHLISHSHSYTTHPHYNSLPHSHNSLSNQLSQQLPPQPHTQAQTSIQSQHTGAPQLQQLQQHPLAVAASAAALQGSSVGVPRSIRPSLGMSNASNLSSMSMPMTTSYRHATNNIVHSNPSPTLYGGNAISSGNSSDYINNNSISYENHNRRHAHSSDYNNNKPNENSSNSSSMQDIINMTSQINVGSALLSSQGLVGHQGLQNQQHVQNPPSSSSYIHVSPTVSSFNVNNNISLIASNPTVSQSRFIENEKLIVKEANPTTIVRSENESPVSDQKDEGNDEKYTLEKKQIENPEENNGEPNPYDIEEREEKEIINSAEQVEEHGEEEKKRGYHTRAMPWAPPTIPVNVPAASSVPPTYGLDSAVDFPPLR